MLLASHIKWNSFQLEEYHININARIPNMQSVYLSGIEIYFTLVQLMEAGPVNKISVMNPLKKSIL